MVQWIDLDIVLLKSRSRDLVKCPLTASHVRDVFVDISVDWFCIVSAVVNILLEVGDEVSLFVSEFVDLFGCCLCVVWVGTWLVTKLVSLGGG